MNRCATFAHRLIVPSVAAQQSRNCTFAKTGRNGGSRKSGSGNERGTGKSEREKKKETEERHRKKNVKERTMKIARLKKRWRVLPGCARYAKCRRNYSLKRLATWLEKRGPPQTVTFVLSEWQRRVRAQDNASHDNTVAKPTLFFSTRLCSATKAAAFPSSRPQSVQRKVTLCVCVCVSSRLSLYGPAANRSTQQFRPLYAATTSRRTVSRLFLPTQLL